MPAFASTADGCRPQGTRALRRLCGLGAAFCLALSCAPPAQAVTCIPVAVGVPALPGAPNFLDKPPPPEEPYFWPRTDDPRWRGALGVGFGAGSTEHVKFRALRTQGSDASLYLSWVVNVAPALNATVDKVRVAFGTGAGMATMLEVQPALGPFGDMNNLPATGLLQSDFAGGSWSTFSNAPSWATSHTRVWVKTSAPRTWAVQMKLPINADPSLGIPLPDEFPMAFEVVVSGSGTTTASYRLSDAVALFNSPPDMLDESVWPRFNIALAPGAAACEKSITLTASDIVNDRPVPHEIALTGVNNFYVLPYNHSLNLVSPQTIRARIRLANWGTTPDWNQGGTSTTLWTEIFPDAGSPAGTGTNTGPIAAGTQATQVNGIKFPWTVPDPCPYTGGSGCPNAPPRRLHQCMLVELSGGGLTFTPASVYRNMDFVTASTFERRAQVSVEGLKPMPGGGAARDVYLYVQTFQMPADVRRAKPRSTTMTDWTKVEAVLGAKPPRPDGVNVQPRAAQQVGAPRQGADFDTLSQQLPTYIVHGYHDTGRTYVFAGRPYKVLEPQTSFGYFVHHDGPLAGWDTVLEGAQQIGPDYYLIAVPEGGSGDVTTRIVAREHDRRWSIGLGLGRALPQSAFAQTHASGPALTLGAGYAYAPGRAWEGTISRYRFDGKGNAPRITSTSIGLHHRWDFAWAGVQPYVTAGAAVHAFDPGSTRAGVTAGAGVDVPLSGPWSVGVQAEQHWVAGNAPRSRFAVAQVWLRHGF